MMIVKNNAIDTTDQSTINHKHTIAEDPPMINTKPSSSRVGQLLSCLPFFCKSSKPVISVLRLCGVVGKVSSMRSGLALDNLNKLIEQAFENSKTAAVFLSINSPGGSPVQSELICARIVALAKEKKIPVYSFIEDVAASGGYWLACAGDEIYASKSSIIGSIGVISSGFGFQEALQKLGIERRVYTEGKNKSILDPFQAAKPADVKIIKQLQSQIHEHFINSVKERRHGRLTQNDDILFNGEFWAGATAHDYGLIDGIEDMYSFIKRKYGSEVKINYIACKQSWLKKKLGMTTGADFSQTFAKGFAGEIAASLVDIAEEKLIQNRFKIR